MNALRRIKNAVKVALGPSPVRLENGRFGPPVESVPGHHNTVEANGRTYRLFFIVGHARSGTNWTGAVLNRHPAICSHGEFRFEAIREGFDTLVRHDWHAAHREPFRSLAEASFRDSVKRVLGGLAHSHPDATWLGDRTPRALDPYLPHAPHFLVLRDPRDMLVSLVHREFTHVGFNMRQPPFMEKLAPVRAQFVEDPDFFKKHPEQLFGDEEFFRFLVRKWHRHITHDLEMLASIERGELDLPVHLVRYERLHADPEGERAKMYGFLGLDPEQAGPLSHDSMSAPGFGRSENPEKFYRKGSVGDWRAYFHDDAIRWFDDEAGALLEQLGYEPFGGDA